MSLSDFKVLSKLGEGAYSTVYKVRRVQDSQIYALKKVKLLSLTEKERENAMSEIRILASLRNPNVVSYKESFIDFPSNSLCIVMEFCDNGDLYQRIQEQQKLDTYMDESAIWRIFLQILLGLKCLHDLNILHRDLKSANVFLNKDGTCKIGDMNVSKVAKDRFLRTQTGTPYYASPELWKDLEYDQKSDIWSLGCVLYEVICLHPPFQAEDMEGLYRQVVRGCYPPIPPYYSKSLNKLLRALLQVSPKLRPSCDGILALPYVHKFLEEPGFFACENEKNLLSKTIRFNNNFVALAQSLPKPNYSLPLIKPIDKATILSELKSHKKASLSTSENHLKLPSIQRENRHNRPGKRELVLQRSFDQPRMELPFSDSSPSPNSSRKRGKKHEIESLPRNSGEFKNHPKFKKKIPEILEVYGIQKKKPKKLDDSDHFLRKQIQSIKEIRSKSTKDIQKLPKQIPHKLSSDSENMKRHKLARLGKAYEVSMDRIDEMQEKCNLENIIPMGKRYKERIMLGSLLEALSKNN